MLWPESYSSSGTVLALHQLRHSISKTVAGEIGGRPLRLLAGGGGAVSATGSAVESNADFAMLFGIAARGVRHQSDDNNNEGGAEDDGPLSFGLACPGFPHGLHSREEVSHLAELLVAVLHGLLGRES